MGQIIITINTDNAAFEDGCSEVVALLREIAEDAEHHRRVPDKTLFDSNGNRVGSISVEE